MTRMAARGRYDYTLLTVLGILVLSGLIILYSTSAYNGEVKFCDSSYYLKKQVFATCLGFLAMFFTAQLDYHRLKNIAWLCYLVALLLSIAVIFVGREYNGSKRWHLVHCHFNHRNLQRLRLFYFWLLTSHTM